jgi:hypothetical protein
VYFAVLDHPNLTVALDDLSFDLADLLIDQVGDVFLALEKASLASITQLGQREPSYAATESRFGFCHDSSGLSDHLGEGRFCFLYKLNCTESKPATLVSFCMLNRSHPSLVGF